MLTTRHAAQFLGLITSALMTLTATARAQPSIHLDGIPDRLSFPLPDGSNVVLTATIKGGQADSVWLAISEDAPRITLVKVDESQYAINLGAEEVCDLLKKRGPEGQFHIFAKTVDGTTVHSFAVRYTMHVVPDRLDFPFDEVQLTIYQRTWKALPGSTGSLRIHLGDITAGQVLVSIFGPSGELVVDTTAMHQGDTLSIHLAEQDYLLQLDKLVNLLIGNDYGVFTLMPTRQFEVHRIKELLGVVEKAEATFIRNGQELSGEQFAALLRTKHEHLGPENASLSEFIEQVATRSSTTGRSYQVKLPSGDIVEADAWLRAQAAKLAKEPKKKGSEFSEDDN